VGNGQNEANAPGGAALETGGGGGGEAGAGAGAIGELERRDPGGEIGGALAGGRRRRLVDGKRLDVATELEGGGAHAWRISAR
jgi:hypothetical protein